ncbi:MAG: 3'(2'),5'-bisphosphate nucleotidase CysQ [Pseudomonadota bacterium]|nr:3'(2'),5'-bisphosphate nucleotidase CysQ [Pseudomonadota bacterium]
MSIYARNPESWLKQDHSPLTAADIAAETIILAGLERHAPGIPVIAEESVAAGRVPEVADRFFLVDPLDGTKEFLSRNGEFTINIALIDDARPVLGVVFAPAIKRLFWASAEAGAFAAEVALDDPVTQTAKVSLRARKVPATGLRVLVSRSHADAETEAWCKSRDIATRLAAGSSLKFCLIASGEADVYPRFGRTMEWDTAAGQAILCAAGGRVLTFAGTPLRYGKKAQSFANPGFIAEGA